MHRSPALARTHPTQTVHLYRQLTLQHVCMYIQRAWGVCSHWTGYWTRVVYPDTTMAINGSNHWILRQ